MIFTDRKITIRNGKSSINEPVILYRGDFEVSIRFTIMESKFRFKSGVNLVDSEKASFGQLAILAPYGGNVFSEIVKCEDGTVTFTLTKEMIDQLEEVGLYSFQIRLFDYYRESRVSIPPVEFGIEVREPVASEDHDNEVNNAIVGYSIAKVVDGLNEDVPDTFDANGQYNKTEWETGDRITEGKLNKIEDALDMINQNEIADVAALDKRITSDFNVLDSTKADKNEIFSMKNMGQDIKEAMTGGSVAVVGENAILNENIVDEAVSYNKTDFIVVGKNLFDKSKASPKGCWINHINGQPESNEYVIPNCYTDFIKVTPGATYFINTAVFAWSQYDALMKHIVGYRITDTNSGMTMTIGDNCHYIRVTIYHSNIDNTQIELGTEFTGYEPYGFNIPKLVNNQRIAVMSEEIDSINEEINTINNDINVISKDILTTNNILKVSRSSNIFNSSELSEIGYWRAWNTGIVGSNEYTTTLRYSSPIPIHGAEALAVDGGGYHRFHSCCFFDESMTFISGLNKIHKTIGNVSAGVLHPPENAAFIVVNVHNSSNYDQERVQICIGEEIQTYAPYSIDIPDLVLHDDIDSLETIIKQHDVTINKFSSIATYKHKDIVVGSATTEREPTSTFTGWAIPVRKSDLSDDMTYVSAYVTAYDNSLDKNKLNNVELALELIDATVINGYLHYGIEVLSTTILPSSGKAEFTISKPLADLPDEFYLGIRATQKCVLMFWNGKSAGYKVLGELPALYSTNYGASTSTTAWSESSSHGYTITEVIVGTGLSFELSEHKHKAEDIEGITFSKAKLSLPDKYELIVEDTFELFYKGILLTNNPDIYNIDVKCSKGNAYKRKYMFTPTVSDIGTHVLTISIYDDGETLLDSKAVNLIVKSKAKSPSTVKNILCVGDSLTSSGIWCREVDRRLTGSGGTPEGEGLSNINFIGTCKNGSTGFEGYGGWTYDNYNESNVYQQQYWIITSNTKPATYQKSIWRDVNGIEWVIESIETSRMKIYRNVYGPQLPPVSGSLTWVSGGDGSSNSDIVYTSYTTDAQNPFWNDATGRVDFKNYATNLGITSIDHCYILLGWNQTTNTENVFKNNARTFINNLRSAFPNCKITLLGLQVPSIDGFGSNYGCNWNFYDKLKVVFNMNKWNYELTEEFDDMDFINIAGQFDTEYNMPRSTRPVNVRNTTTEVYGTNGVHPDISGYLQIADAVYRHLSQNL